MNAPCTGGHKSRRETHAKCRIQNSIIVGRKALREDKILLAWLGKNLIALKQVYHGLGSRELTELEPRGHAALTFISEKYSYFFDFGAWWLEGC